MTTLPDRPYFEVRALLKSIGGEMTYRPGGDPAGGGVWVLRLWGRTTEVEVRDHSVNRLDLLYVAKVKSPKTWEDYDATAKLVDGAEWKLVALFQ